MEILISHEEAARRDRVGCLFNRVEDLMPGSGGIPKKKYESAYFAPRVRLFAYQGDDRAKRVLESWELLKESDDNIVFSYERPLLSLKSGNHTAGLLYDDKFRVLLGRVDDENQKRANLVMEDLLVLTNSDLFNGRKAWSEILQKRRAKFYDSSIVFDETEKLAYRLGSQVVVAKEAKSEDGRRNINIYAPEIYKYDNIKTNLINSYREVDYATKRFGFDDNGNEVFSLDFPNLGLRVRELPKMSDLEASTMVEESFEDFMRGDAHFSVTYERLGEVELLKYNKPF